MKRTRAQNPKLEDPEVVKPQRRIKQPKVCSNKTAASEPATTVPAADVASAGPDVCAAGGDETAAEWDVDGWLDAGSWWTFAGVEEEKLRGWFPFVEEDFRCFGSGRGDADAAAFDDDIWRIHQIYEIPSYAAK